MKRILTFTLVSVFILISVPAFAFWGNFYVKSAGPYENPTQFPEVGKIMMVGLEPVTGGTLTFYRIEATQQNEIYAAALTAISTGQPVRANIVTNYSNGHWSDQEVVTLWIYASEAELP